ncbi:hypothetical protein Tco_0355944 [Tanacetum coccineum]
MSGEEPATQIAPVESPQMVSIVKILSLKKVILNGNGPIQVTTDENGVETEVPPKTAQALLARQRERKAKSILLLAIPDEYQLRFHAIKDVKTLWATIKSRFCGNVESKKIQKNVLKQQFENFSVSDIEGLHKAYDRFQKLISLLEVHGADVSNEDANQKFFTALPSSWNNVALIMRNKAGINDLDIDDLYNNLKVFEADIKGFFGSSSNSQNVAFLSTEDTSSNNEVSTANGGMLSMRVKDSIRRLKEINSSMAMNCGLIKLRLNALTVIEGAIFQGNDNALVVQDNALIVQDGLGYDWSYVAQDEPIEFALMAYTSNSPGSDIEDRIFISQDKYVAKILKKFDFATVKTTSTPMEPNKALVKDKEADSVDVHLYRSMIGSLMYLTASRPDITFVVCACARQVLWIQNQMLDYGFNFMNTKIYIDNECTICIVKNPVFYSKTKHIEIMHHFIRDSYEKRLIQGRLMVYKCSGLYTNAIWIEVGRIEKQIHANVDGKDVVVSESSVRRDLHLNDEDGTVCLTTNEIFEKLALMGYKPAFDKLTFYKGLFSPQWKYLIHTILHCLSSKSTSWDQFSTNLASAIICLAKGQKFIFSKMIFDGKLRNLDPKKFLMYPRFLQLFLNIQLPNLVIPFNDIHETPKLTKKVFTNMRKPGKGFSGRVTPLIQNMLVPPVVVGEVTTTAASQLPKDPNTFRRTKRGRNTKVPQSSSSPNKVGYEAINEEMFDSVERAATTASSLEAEQASGNINKTQFMTTLNEPFFLELGSGGHTLGSGEDSMEHQIELTNNVPNTPHDSPLPGVNTPGSDEGSLELNELMDLVTKLSHRVFDLEKVKTAQAKEITGLKRRVTKLEQRQRSRILKNHPFRFGSSRRQSLGKKDVSKQGRKHLKTQLQFGEDAFDDIDDLVDEGMAFVQEKDAENQGKIGADDTEVVKGSGDTEVLDTEKAVNTAGEGVSTASISKNFSTAAPRTPPTKTVFDDEDVTMAMSQTFIKIKEEKAKEKEIVSS